MRTTAVFGVSGVGKSWLISRFVARNGGAHVSASGLLKAVIVARDAREPESEELRTGAVSDNQALIVEGFRDLRSKQSAHIIFDGHNLIDGQDGLVEIEFEVISAIDPSAIIVVADDPARIAQRRLADKSRPRPSRLPEEIGRHQDRVIEIARSHSDRLGVPLHIVSSEEIEAFSGAASL